MKITARLDALERKAAEAHDGNAGYRIFRQDLDAGSYLDDAGRAYSRAEIDALSAAGVRCIVIEYGAWPPGGE